MYFLFNFRRFLSSSFICCSNNANDAQKLAGLLSGGNESGFGAHAWSLAFKKACKTANQAVKELFALMSELGRTIFKYNLVMCKLCGKCSTRTWRGQYDALKYFVENIDQIKLMCPNVKVHHEKLDL